MLESISIFALKHELELLPTLMAIVSMVRLNAQGIQIIRSPGVEAFQSSDLLGELKWNVGASQWLFGCHEAITLGGLLRVGGKNACLLGKCIKMKGLFG